MVNRSQLLPKLQIHKFIDLVSVILVEIIFFMLYINTQKKTYEVLVQKQLKTI